LGGGVVGEERGEVGFGGDAGGHFVGFILSWDFVMRVLGMGEV
jgi:hypothetical protein